MNRHFTITKQGLAQFRHGGAALGPGGPAKRPGHKQVISEQSRYVAEKKALVKLSRHFTITKQGLEQFRHAAAALGPGGPAKRPGHKQVIDEQSWYVAEKKGLEKLSRHFTITKQGLAACTSGAVLARRGGARLQPPEQTPWAAAAHRRTKLACN